LGKGRPKSPWRDSPKKLSKLAGDRKGEDVSRSTIRQGKTEEAWIMDALRKRKENENSAEEEERGERTRGDKVCGPKLFGNRGERDEDRGGRVDLRHSLLTQVSGRGPAGKAEKENRDGSATSGRRASQDFLRLSKERVGLSTRGDVWRRKLG